MYRMYGDYRIIKENYAAMQAWLGFIGSSNPDLIWRNRTNHNYGDWLSVNAATPKEVVSTAYYANDALLLSYMSKAIGRNADAEKYRQLHANIAKAFNREFVDSKTAIMKGDTQADYVLALEFKLLPTDGLIQKAVAHLVDNVKTHKWHLTTGFIGKFFSINRKRAYSLLNCTGE